MPYPSWSMAVSIQQGSRSLDHDFTVSSSATICSISHYHHNQTLVTIAAIQAVLHDAHEVKYWLWPSWTRGSPISPADHICQRYGQNPAWVQHISVQIVYVWNTDMSGSIISVQVQELFAKPLLSLEILSVEEGIAWPGTVMITVFQAVTFGVIRAWSHKLCTISKLWNVLVSPSPPRIPGMLSLNSSLRTISGLVQHTGHEERSHSDLYPWAPIASV
ncbi:hypothetical protein BD414DRAFT_115891 [Trametes punicea]|nr:hypothetical protein BD414DRAFT_115891 [Trametes punicea]